MTHLKSIKFITAVSVATALCACAPQGGETSADIAPEVKSAACAPINGLDAVLDSPLPRVIVLGEMHGMTTPPDFAQALVCHSLARGLRTALGFEFNDDEERRISGYLNSDGGIEEQAEFFQNSYFLSAMTDGRTSEAMLGLFDYARANISRDDFTPFLFKESDADFTRYEEDPKGVLGDIERDYADNILAMANSGAIDKTIVLVGNKHALRSRNPYGPHDYEFMAAHMPAPETMTLFNLYTSGTSWNCRGTKDGGHSCGENETGGYIDAESELAKTDSYEIFTQPDPRLTQAATDPIKDAVTDSFGDSYDALFFSARRWPHPLPMRMAAKVTKGPFI